MGRLTVLAQPLGEVWVPFGTDRRRGVYVEDFQASSDSGGPLDASFMLRRTPRTYWPDLGYATPVKAYDDGMLVWGGRIRNSPGTDGDDRNVQVQCEGWQAHTDDRPYSKMFVHSSMSDWQDAHSLVGSTLAPAANGYMAGAQVSSGDGAITLTFPNALVTLSGNRCAAVLDLGPISTAKRVVVTYTLSANDANVYLYCLGSDIQDTSPGTAETAFSTALSGSGGTSAATFATPHRYVHLALLSISNHTMAAEVTAKITSVQVFAATAYESGNASILTSTTIVLEALSRLQLISSDRSRIGTTSYALPAFSANDQTVRDVTIAANAFQDWQFRIREDRVPEYRARPSSPLLSLTDQSAFDDASAGSGESIYNEVTYTGTGPDGTPVVVTRTATAAGLPLTIPDRRVYTKAYVIQSSAPLTSAAASQLCDVFLSQRNRTPFKGTIHVSSRRAISLNPSGTPIPPSLLLRYGGEMCSFKHLQDPDTGALGRDGRVAQVTWTHASNSAEVAIDSSPYSFEAMFARLAIATTR